ncbi:hypothetical protein [Tenacibaculum sp.]|uniref:hypothetical protein n=1 Tax=Tenacibaculum sp. TaxID=1906242 RepID=UPI003D116862
MKEWIKTGLSWGFMMFLVMTIFFPLYDGEEITLKRILVGALVWGVGGLFFGYTMNINLNKKD